MDKLKSNKRLLISLFLRYNLSGDIMLYTSKENKKIKDIKKLQSKKYRDLTGKYIIEGDHLIKEAYNAGYLDEILVEEGSNIDINVPVNYVSRDILKYLSNLDNPNIIGICHKKDEEKIGNRVVILEDIQDPGNLGTIIRSSVAFNIDTIIISKNSVDLYNDKVIRATQGMIFKINIIVRDVIEIVEKLKGENYHIYGTKVDNGKELKSIENYDKFAIIMGNEGAGISQEVSNLCDTNIYIKMNQSCESLNVGVATSIILYELDR